MEILFVTIVATLLLGAIQSFGRYVCDYVVTESDVQVRLLRFPVLRYQLTDIRSAEEVPYRETLRPQMGVLRFGNKLIGRCIVLNRKSGFFSRVILTPDDVDGFLSQIQARLPSEN